MDTTTAPIPALPKYADECREMLAKWDSDGIIWSIEMGGLGPGHEQCIQIMAVEFTRACIDLPLEGETEDERHKVFWAACEMAIKPINKDLGGVSGAQFGASAWLARMWLHETGPAGLIARAKAEGHEDRAIQITRAFPRAPIHGGEHADR